MSKQRKLTKIKDIQVGNIISYHNHNYIIYRRNIMKVQERTKRKPRIIKLSIELRDYDNMHDITTHFNKRLAEYVDNIEGGSDIE